MQSVRCQTNPNPRGEPDLALTITVLAATLQAPDAQLTEVTGTPAIPAGTPSAPTETPTASPTGTPGVPQIGVSAATNCRSGPSKYYDLVYEMHPGMLAAVIGKNSDTGYWIIQYPGGTCWLWGQYASVTGDTTKLQKYEVPPTPTPAKPAAPANLHASVTCDPSGWPNVVYAHLQLTWDDMATNEDGYTVYEEGTAVATLSENSDGYAYDPPWVFGLGEFDLGTPGPTANMKYGVEAFNEVGASARKNVTAACP